MNSGHKLIITSSGTKDVYIRPCISLIRYHMQKYMSYIYSRILKTSLVYFIYLYNLFESKIRVLIQIKLCKNARIHMDLSKNNCFSAEEAINYVPRTEKRKKVPVCEMLESSGSLSSPILPVLSWKQKIIAYRDSSTIHPSSKLSLLFQYKITS